MISTLRNNEAMRRRKRRRLHEIRQQATRLRTTGLVQPAPAEVMASIRRDLAAKRKRARMFTWLGVIGSLALLILLWYWLGMVVKTMAST